MSKRSILKKIEVITLDASDDEVVECTDHSFGKGIEDERCYVIRMQNIPDPCSENVIVDFFRSDDNGEPVCVFLGRDGVLLKRSGTNTYQAFVLFKRKNMAKKALLKNCQPMGTSLVHITDKGILDTMFKEFSLRPRSNISVRAEDRKRIVLSNIPSQASQSDIKNFLEPYNALVSPRIKHYKYRIPEENYCDLTVAMISKLAAIFVVMKKNGTDMNLDGVQAQIHLKMYGYSSQGEGDSSIPYLTSILNRSRAPFSSHLTKRRSKEFSLDISSDSNNASADSINEAKEEDAASSELSVIATSVSSQPEIFSDISLPVTEPGDSLQIPDLKTDEGALREDLNDVQAPYPDSFFLVCVRNLPVACSAKQVVDFFASDIPAGPVNVCLGPAGVVLQTVHSSTFAYVILQSWNDRCRAIQKNFGKIEDRHVCIENCSLWKAMYIGCALRSKPVAVPESRQSISMKNLPLNVTLQDVFAFLQPYDIWILPESPNLITRSPFSENEEEGLFQFHSELAAFFVFMNKNHAPIEVNGCRRLVRITMLSAFSPSDTEFEAPSLKNPLNLLKRPIIIKNVKREPPTGQNSWATVRLANLPPDITEEDIQDLFSERVSVPPSNIALLRVTQFSTNASVVFPSREEGIKAVDNIRSFEIEEHVVPVRLCTYSEE